METIENLELQIREWYLIKGYANNETNWFTLELKSKYKKKCIAVIDNTSKTKHDRYIFTEDRMDRVIAKALKYFKGEINEI